MAGIAANPFEELLHRDGISLEDLEEGALVVQEDASDVEPGVVRPGSSEQGRELFGPKGRFCRAGVDEPDHPLMGSNFCTSPNRLIPEGWTSPSRVENNDSPHPGP